MAAAAVLLLLLLLPALADGAVTSLTVRLLSPLPLATGQTIHVAYNLTASPGDAANLTRALLTPYIDGAQYGAEVGLLWCDAASGAAGGTAFLPLPWSAAAALHTLQLAAQGAAQGGATMGAAPPAGALLSNALALPVALRAPARPTRAPAPGEPLLTMYLETWFSPLNSYWQGAGGGGLAEAIPAIGRYASVDVASIRAQAAAFVQGGIDAVVVDWTNNCWGCASWGDRGSNIQELVNATSLHMGVYAALRRDEGWEVPRFIHLLGLNNGPTTPLPALMEELDFIAQAYLGNASLGPGSFVQLEGRPLVLIFDGSGGDHSAISHANFTLRWMASQLQSSPSFAARGIWSWMDGTLQPLVSRAASGAAEAATLAPAFFGRGGWLARGTAAGRSGGLTLLAEYASVAAATAPALPAFVNLCQWNEFNGQPGAAPSYTDSYSPDLSNDLEPTSPFACAYARPGNVRCGGGWGYSGLNAVAMLRAAMVDASAVVNSSALLVLAPAVGDRANYSAPGFITVSWLAVRFERGAPLALANVSLPVALEIDGQVVATLPAPPGAPGVASAQVSTRGLDARFPHILTLRALPAPGGAHTTRWPLSFDYLDADAGALPLAQPVPAAATAWLWLPESQEALAP